MAILWMGCQPEDLKFSGSYTVSTSGSNYDTIYSNGGVDVVGYEYTYTGPNTRYVWQDFSQPSSDFWFAFRATTNWFSNSISGYGAVNAPGRPFIWFTDPTAPGPLHMRFSVNYGFDDRKLYVRVYDNGGNPTTLITRDVLSAPAMVINGSSSTRFDVHLRLGKGDGIFRLYQGGVLIVDFTGDTLGSLDYSTVSGWAIGPTGYYGATISELFAIERDSRTMRMKSHTMSALDAANEWSGVVANINEFNPDTGTIMSSNTAEQILDATVADLPNTSMYPYAVKVNVRATKADDGGPSAIQIGVKSNGMNDLASETPLSTAYETYSRMMITNPTTGLNWTAAEVNDLHLLVKSKP